MSDFDADSFIQQHESNSFDPDAFISAHDDSGGLLSSIARGAGKVASAIDSYTGAPTRAAIGAVQDTQNDPNAGFLERAGNDISNATSAAWKQFGADPSNAPTGKDIAEKAGLSTDSILSPGAQRMASIMLKETPAGFMADKFLPGSVEDVAGASPAGIAGQIVDAGANPLNVLPVGEMAGGAAKLAGRAMEAAGDAAGGAAKWGATKMLSNLGGVSPDMINEYLPFSERINSALSMANLKDISDKVVGKLASDVEAGNLSVEQSQAAFDGLKSDLKDTFGEARYDAKDALTSAQQTLKDAHGSNLKQLSGDVYDTINQLKSDVQAGSSSALDTLDKSGAKVDLAPVYSQIDSTIYKMRAAGTDDSLGVADKLQAYKERLLNNNWAQIDAPQAKQLIQGIDKTTTYSPMAGSFDQAKNAAFKGIRGALDQSLKTAVPEYAAAMQPVAADAGLLNRVSQFGDKQTGAGLLGRINAPNQLENRAALQELGQKYGADFVNSANPKNLPQQALVDSAQARLDALRPDKVSDKIEQTLAASRQKAGLDAAQANLSQAQEKLAPYKSLAPNGADQTAVQQKLMTLGKGKDIELTKMFTNLGKLSDTDFVQAMHDQSIQAAFQKGAYNGSRNTLFGTIIGGAIGGLTGGAESSAIMASGGASLGRLADQWGPAITKKILDAGIKISNSPTMDTIRSLSLPDSIKQNMAQGLQAFLSKGGVAAGSGAMANNSGAGQSNGKMAGPSQVNRSPAVGEDKWAQQGLQSLGIQDQGFSSRLLQDPKAKQLLIQASDLKPGSRAMKNIMDQIQKGWGR